jgi:hypothetical protein
MKRLVVILGMSVAGVLSGCATNLITYKPDANQSVAYNQGVGSITSDGSDASLVMYPTFRYQSGSDLPTFTLIVQDKNGQPLDFDPEGVRAFVDNGRECHVLRLQVALPQVLRDMLLPTKPLPTPVTDMWETAPSTPAVLFRPTILPPVF